MKRSLSVVSTMLACACVFEARCTWSFLPTTQKAVGPRTLLGGAALMGGLGWLYWRHKQKGYSLPNSPVPSSTDASGQDGYYIDVPKLKDIPPLSFHDTMTKGMHDIMDSHIKRWLPPVVTNIIGDYAYPMEDCEIDNSLMTQRQGEILRLLSPSYLAYIRGGEISLYHVPRASFIWDKDMPARKASVLPNLIALSPDENYGAFCLAPFTRVHVRNLIEQHGNELGQLPPLPLDDMRFINNDEVAVVNHDGVMAIHSISQGKTRIDSAYENIVKQVIQKHNNAHEGRKVLILDEGHLLIVQLLFNDSEWELVGTVVDRATHKVCITFLEEASNQVWPSVLCWIKILEDRDILIDASWLYKHFTIIRLAPDCSSVIGQRVLKVGNVRLSSRDYFSVRGSYLLKYNPDPGSHTLRHLDNIGVEGCDYP